VRTKASFDLFSWLEHTIVRIIVLGLLLIAGYKLLMTEFNTINHPPLAAPETGEATVRPH
jgi:hypothetical protein